MKRKIDLTIGKISTALFTLALPIMGSAFISMAYNLYDMYTLGHISSDALAAAGTGGFFMMLSFALVMLTRTGTEVKVSQSLGAKDDIKARSFSTAGFQLALGLSFLYAILVFLFQNPLIAFFQIEDEVVVKMIHQYLSIVIFSAPLTIGLNLLTGVFNAGGLSNIPFIASILGLVVKIGLNYLFVNVFGWSVSGAASATLVAQGITFLSLLMIKLRYREGYLSFTMIKPVETSYYLSIIKLGFPVALQSFIFSLIAIYIGRLVASFGKEAISVQRLGTQIESVSWMTANGFGAALSAFVGQNYGAKQYRRVIQGFRTGTIIVAMIGIGASALLMIFPQALFGIFVNEPKVIEMGAIYLYILGISQFFQSLEISTNGAFNGVGLTKYPSIMGIIIQSLRIPAALILMNTSLGLSGIFWAISLSTVLKGIIGVSLFYFIVIRKLNQGQPVT